MHLFFDIGGTHLRVGYSADGKKVTAWDKKPTPSDFETGLKELTSLAQQLTKQEPVKQVIGGIAGILDSTHSSLHWSPNLQGWINKPLKKELEQIFKCPVFLENDAALAGLGEAHYGAGKGYDIVAYITVSTGVGGARIINGKIDKRSFGFEPGQQIVDMHSGQTLEQLVTHGDKQKQAEYVACGLNNVVTLWSPEVVILGGGLMNQINVAEVKKHVLTICKLPESVLPPIVPAKHPEDNGLWGALVYA